MTEAQERDEVVESARRFLETAPKVECMAFGVIVEMISEDEPFALFKEATAKGMRKPSQILDYMVQAG